MRIRLANSEDQRSVSECVDAAYGKYIERIGKKPAPMLANYSELIRRGSVHVAVDNGNEMTGLIVTSSKETYLLIENVSVYPRLQRQGVGQALIEFAIELARKALFKEVRLYTNELMNENLSYYAKFGFVEVDRKTENGYRRVFMSKSLGSDADTRTHTRASVNSEEKVAPE